MWLDETRAWTAPRLQMCSRATEAVEVHGRAEDAVAPHVCGCCRPFQDQLDERHAQMQEDEAALENKVALEAKLNQ
eukprot:1287305-Amphidinium_carterae.1